MLKLLKKFEDFFDGTIGTWKVDLKIFRTERKGRTGFLEAVPHAKVT